jgi:hypothetical protein
MIFLLKNLYIEIFLLEDWKNNMSPYNDEMDRDDERRASDAFDYENRIRDFHKRSRKVMIDILWILGIIALILICISLLWAYGQIKL